MLHFSKKNITFETKRLSTLGYIGFENHHWPAARRFDCPLFLHLLDYFLSHFPFP